MEIYQNIIEKYKRTGTIGRTKPYNMDHAKRIAWAIATKLNKNTTTGPRREGVEPLTAQPICCQLKLF